MKNFDLYKKRVLQQEWNKENRVVCNKIRTLKSAMRNPYLGFDVSNPFEEEDKTYHVLIASSDIAKEQKITSLFENGIKVGSIVYWKRMDSYWLVFFQNVNEIAYFEGKMLECESSPIVSEDGIISTWGHVRIKTEDSEQQVNKTIIVRDRSELEVWIPNSTLNSKHFSLHSTIHFNGSSWEIKEIDSFTHKGILKLTTERVPNSEIIEDITPVNNNTHIIGPNIIYPLEEVVYSHLPNENEKWTISENDYITKSIDNSNNLHLTWNNNRKRKDIIIYYGKYKKTVHVQSMM